MQYLEATYRPNINSFTGKFAEAVKKILEWKQSKEGPYSMQCNIQSNAKHHMSLPKWVMSKVGWGKL